MIEWPADDPRPRRGADAELTLAAAALLRATPGDEGPRLAARVAVRWNPRLTSTAGQARAAQALVTLNPRLPEFPGELDRTLRHELAHLLAAERGRSAGRKRIAAHGPEWRRACTDLGIADETRCHSLPLPRRRLARRHAYLCPSCRIIIRRVKPLPKRRPMACLWCCRQHAGGRYDARFRFVETAMEEGQIVGRAPRLP